MFQTKGEEKIKTRILFRVTYFSKNRAVYDIMWENGVERGTPQMTIWLKRVAFWIPEATNTHSECVKLINFPLQHWLQDASQ